MHITAPQLPLRRTVAQSLRQLHNGRAFWARAAAGLITLEDLRESLVSVAEGGRKLLASANLILQGAHGQPLLRRVGAGQNAFWLAGDWGRDDHGARSGHLGLAEVGVGRNFGPAQLNVALGQTWARQRLVHGGRASVEGTYLLAEGLIPLQGPLWGVVGAYYHWGRSDIRRGYLAPAQQFSHGAPDLNGWGVRARLQWDARWHAAGASFSPYVDLSHKRARMDAYTETGGGFPASFAAREDRATELRLGLEAAHPIGAQARLLATLEGVHRFEGRGGGVAGSVPGVTTFNFAGADNDRNWLRAGLGVQGRLAGGTGHVMLNTATPGEASNVWLAAGWQRAF